VLEDIWQDLASRILDARDSAAPSTIAPGISFAESVPGGLPEPAIKVYRDIAMIDKLMAAAFRPGRNDNLVKNDLIGMRNSAIHRFLCLPSWDDLQASTATLYKAPYEICRLSVNIYANSVLLGLEPGQWRLRMVSELRQAIEFASLDAWAVDTFPLLAWALIVGGIAAFGTEHRQFFAGTLSRIMAIIRGCCRRLPVV
jgi:hypothetical protein